MAKQKIYFAKLQYNDDFYTYSSFSLTYSHTYCNINYIKIYSVLASDCYLPTDPTM
jgi:hypothetical protein